MGPAGRHADGQFAAEEVRAANADRRGRRAERDLRRAGLADGARGVAEHADDHDQGLMADLGAFGGRCEYQVVDGDLGFFTQGQGRAIGETNQ